MNISSLSVVQLLESRYDLRTIGKPVDGKALLFLRKDNGTWVLYGYAGNQVVEVQIDTSISEFGDVILGGFFEDERRWYIRRLLSEQCSIDALCGMLVFR